MRTFFRNKDISALFQSAFRQAFYDELLGIHLSSPFFFSQHGIANVLTTYGFQPLFMSFSPS